MFWTIRWIALWLLFAALAAPLQAEPTPGPPAWQDQASVYLTGAATSNPDTVTSAPLDADDADHAGDVHDAGDANLPFEALPMPNYNVERAAHQAAAVAPAAASDSRRLAPPSKPWGTDGATQEPGIGKQPVGASRGLSEFGLPVESIYTILSALAVVIGLFLVFAWLLRRGTVGRNRIGGLPADVVSVLGRVSLTNRQSAELLRVGNKLVLVSITPAGAEPITEVTEPTEVDRLVGLCQQHNPHSTTKAFEQVFRQLSSEAAPSGFLGGATPPSSFSPPAGAYRGHRGEARG